MTRHDLFPHCPVCGSRLNTRPDRVCMSCRGHDRDRQGDREQNCGTEVSDLVTSKVTGTQRSRNVD